MTTKTAQWKRYPNRSGAARFQAYYTLVEVLETETRTVPKMRIIHDPNGGPTRHERIEIQQEFSRIRVNGKSQWIPSSELV